MQELISEADRRRAIAWAVALTAETHLAPDQYEWELLERYARGELVLDEVLRLLDGRVYHLLYRSQARRPFNRVDLACLVEQSRIWNEGHGVTGLLCYCSSGHFVQVLEGPASEVQALFTRIQQDRRHTQVQALSEYTSTKRWFGDWQMALAEAEPAEYYWLLGYLEAKGHNLVQPQLPIDSPHLTTLLREFSRI